MPKLNFPHRRYNPLMGEYVLVSPHRTQRPWQGQQEKPAPEQRPSYDPKCYLCPGNERAGGVTNPDYDETFVFTNDFAALLPNTPEVPPPDHPLLQAFPVRGTARVLCFSPRHDLTLAEMDLPGIRRVVDLWAHQVEELGETYAWVQIFQNQGSAMGASNPHPHGQLWAQDILPNIVRAEDDHQRAYYAQHGQTMLAAYTEYEAASGERTIAENDDWLIVVPYWATWPFETLVLPKRDVQRLPDLTNHERNTLAEALKRLLVKYDNLFEVPFPYSMGWHGAPYNGEDNAHWTLHAHFYPPLLRSATVRKFMVGYEMLGESQRDLTAEAAAARLQEMADQHYKARS